MSTYYTDTLYPLQDKVLAHIDSLDLPFYLTGGTALSRCYFPYRYSDDLDFFVNNDSQFHQHTSDILRSFHAHGIHHIVESQSETYVSIRVEKLLRVDFVNDIPSHIGKIVKERLFSRVDSTDNILANKVTALISRDEPKDVADLWILHKHTQIQWEKAFTDVNSKAVGILPPDVAQRLETFPQELLETINWIEDKQPDTKDFQKDIQDMITLMLKL